MIKRTLLTTIWTMELSKIIPEETLIMAQTKVQVMHSNIKVVLMDKDTLMSMASAWREPILVALRLSNRNLVEAHSSVSAKVRLSLMRKD